MLVDPLSAPSFPRAVLEAVPYPVFLVAKDYRVIQANEAAHRFVDEDGGATLLRICGEALRCAHASGEEGCGGTEHCSDCVVRGAVSEVLDGKQVERRRAALRLEGPAGRRQVHVLVSASRLDLPGEPVAMLIVEDITEWIELEGIVPICSECKKIRSDAEYWEQVETYIAKRTRIEFSHGLCPECAAALVEKYGL